MSESPIKFRVAICIPHSGGGVGGLTVAYALSKSPHIHIDIYEAASKFTEIGAGINVWWRTRQVLKTLGLEDDVLRLLPFRPGEDRGKSGHATVSDFSESPAVPSIQYRKADQPEGGLLGVRRADFHETLLNRLTERCRTFTSKRLQSYTQSPDRDVPILLEFHDGTTATCDILIGADGIKSVVRKRMLQEAAVKAEVLKRDAEAAELRNLIEPRFSGVFAYRTLIPSEKLISISPQHRVFSSTVQYLGKNRASLSAIRHPVSRAKLSIQHMIAYPISFGRFINFIGYEVYPDKEGTYFEEAWVADADPKYVSKMYDGWDTEVSELMQITRWAINALETLPFYSFGNVAILGDAAHAMTPFQGAGAGQAIEDALVLSTLLAHERTTKRNAQQVLEIYSRVRQPVATGVARRSRMNGEYFSLRWPGLDKVLGKVQENLEWFSETDAGVDLERAIELLKTEVVT
ncbi:salicylate hydroxylase [Multifurca ochricompacta]|uniref:Salicylate hydroxylase n=1 Tax=Multifurca ochricompacta TaxID=376703 RepID=A0AAD4QKI0_9AGAM|nr:salicylate hydroxylase [Multifurca ochricompacta]